MLVGLLSNKLDFIVDGNFVNGLKMELLTLIWVLKSLCQSVVYWTAGMESAMSY